jgi:hypothetical protein
MSSAHTYHHIRNVKTAKSAQTDIYYLRDMFGPICEALKVTSRKVSAKAKKRPPKPGQDGRRKAPVIEKWLPAISKFGTSAVALRLLRLFYGDQTIAQQAAADTSEPGCTPTGP